MVNNCHATTLAFSIRELSRAISYKATIYVNGMPTAFSAVIPDGSTSYKIIATNSLALQALDQISIYLSYTGGGALNNGICATLLTI